MMISTLKFRSYSHLLYYCLVFLIGLTISCKNKTAQRAIIKRQAQANTITKPNYDSLITTPCALVLYPTKQQIDRMKKEDGEDFATVVDDDQFYMADCLTYLDSVKFKPIIKDSKGILGFKTADNQLYELKLDTLSWTVILFNGKTKPYKADITVFADEFKSHMK